MKTTAVILAGGKSARLGQDKALLEFEGKSLIQRVFDTLKPIFKKIYIITNNKDRFLFLDSPVVSDIYPNNGPMGGIYTGLFYSKSPVFAVACDMPFLDPAIVQFLDKRLQNCDAAVFRSPEGVHPLHACYSQSVLSTMKDCLIHGDVKMVNFLDKVKTLEINVDKIRSLDPHGRFLSNINTYDDLKRCREMTKF